MRPRRIAAFIVVSCLLFVSAIAPAQEPRGVGRNVVTVTARVERVDLVSRALTLRTVDGVERVVSVGPELEVFRELQNGDIVLVRIDESVIVEVKPGAKPTLPADTTADAKKAPEAAHSDVLQQLKGVVTIESIDPLTQTIIYKGADNRRVQRQVVNPHLLEGLKAGDVIEVTYTRARAISLQRQP